MKPVAPVLALVVSVGLLVLSFVLLPVFEFDTPLIPRADVPPACTEAAGFLLAFFAARRLIRWQRLVAYLVLLLHSFSFVVLLWQLRVDSHSFS